MTTMTTMAIITTTTSGGNSLTPGRRFVGIGTERGHAVASNLHGPVDAGTEPIDDRHYSCTHRNICCRNRFTFEKRSLVEWIDRTKQL